jgi:crotonobetainyl-CoA:carnitine CoA-transferase CaiB-like acyl-CoA transferase
MNYSLAGIMECRDGYVMLLLIEDHHWWRMVKAMGDPAWAYEERFNTNYKRTQHAEEINRLIQAWLSRHSKEELYHELQKQGIPFSPVSSPGEVLASSQLKSRGFFFEHDHPLAGKLSIPSVPYLFSERADKKPGPAPHLGEHNQDVYGLLGYTEEEIAGLRQEGII